MRGLVGASTPTSGKPGLDASLIRIEMQRAFDRLRRQFPLIAGKVTAFSFVDGSTTAKAAHGLGFAPNKDNDGLLIQISDTSQTVAISGGDSTFVNLTRSSSSGALTGRVLVW